MTQSRASVKACSHSRRSEADSDECETKVVIVMQRRGRGKTCFVPLVVLLDKDGATSRIRAGRSGKIPTTSCAPDFLVQPIVGLAPDLFSTLLGERGERERVRSRGIEMVGALGWLLRRTSGFGHGRWVADDELEGDPG